MAKQPKSVETVTKVIMIDQLVPSSGIENIQVVKKN